MSLSSSMPDIELLPFGVKKLLDNLKPHEASGLNSIPPMVLKERSKEDWKEANVAPIFKKGDNHKPSN